MLRIVARGEGGKEVGYSLKQDATTEALTRPKSESPGKFGTAGHKEVKRGSHLKHMCDSFMGETKTRTRVGCPT